MIFFTSNLIEFYAYFHAVFASFFLKINLSEDVIYFRLRTKLSRFSLIFLAFVFVAFVSIMERRENLQRKKLFLLRADTQ